jgi:hypothetical protein
MGKLADKLAAQSPASQRDYLGSVKNPCRAMLLVAMDNGSDVRIEHPE